MGKLHGHAEEPVDHPVEVDRLGRHPGIEEAATVNDAVALR
jgi:hypothetical protein